MIISSTWIVSSQIALTNKTLQLTGSFVHEIPYKWYRIMDTLTDPEPGPGTTACDGSLSAMLHEKPVCSAWNPCSGPGTGFGFLLRGSASGSGLDIMLESIYCSLGSVGYIKLFENV